VGLVWDGWCGVGLGGEGMGWDGAE
jgi:hypothetical protein